MPRELTADERARARSAAGMIPGVAQSNALSKYVGNADPRRSQSVSPTEASRRQQEAAMRRRQRVERSFQRRAQEAGRAPYSRNELDAMLAEEGL